MRFRIPLVAAFRLASLTTLVSTTIPSLAAPQEPKATALSQQQKDQLKERDRLFEEADRLRRLNQTKQSLEMTERGLEIEASVLGPNRPDYIVLVTGVALLYEQLDDCRSAARLYASALGAAREVYGESGWQTTDARLALATAERKCKFSTDERRELREAQRLDREGLELSKRGLYEKALAPSLASKNKFQVLLGTRSKEYARACLGLAVLYKQLGSLDQARDTYDECAAIYRDLLTESHPDYAACLTSMSVLLADMGKDAAAFEHAERACKILESVRAESHTGYGPALINLGSRYFEMGQWSRSVEILKRSPLLKDATTEAHNWFPKAHLHSNLGMAYRTMGDYAAAVEHLETARDIFEKYRAQTLREFYDLGVELSRVFLEFGDPIKAAEAFNRGIQGQGDSVFGSPETLNHMASFADALQKPDLAKSQYRLALERVTSWKPYDATLHSVIVMNLAGLHFRLGEYEEALRLGAEVEKLRGKGAPLSGHQLATYRTNMASFHAAAHQHDKALELFESARAIYRELATEDHPHCLKAISNQAVVHYRLGQTAAAASLMRDGFERALRNRSGAFRHMSARERVQYIAAHRTALDFCLTFLLEDGRSSSEVYGPVFGIKGYATSLRTRDQDAWSRPDLKPLAAEMLEKSSAVARLALDVPSSALGQDKWVDAFRRARAEKEALERKLVGSSKRYAALHNGDPQALANCLPRRTAIVDFVQYTHIDRSAKEVRGEPHLLAFVLTQGNEPALVRLGPVKPIADSIRTWRDAVAQGQTPAGAGRFLGRHLWEPLATHLKGKSAVLVATDGVVNNFPFAALPGTASGSFLVEELAIGYLTSARQYLEVATAPDPVEANGLFAVGGVEYGPVRPAGPKLGALPSSRAEVEDVRALHSARFADGSKSVAVTGAEATAVRVLKELGRGDVAPPFGFLHLATHGAADALRELAGERDAARNALTLPQAHREQTLDGSPQVLMRLAFAGANESLAGGTITAEEVAALNLSTVNVAVLSACETGLGVGVSTEGKVSLQQAFQIAGAKTLVASLWKVPDRETRVLMAEFYRALWDGPNRVGKIQALRRAQTAMINRFDRETGTIQEGPGQGQRLPPLWWAGWVSSGDPGAELEGQAAGSEPAAPDVPHAASEGADRRWLLVAGVSVPVLIFAYRATARRRRA